MNEFEGDSYHVLKAIRDIGNYIKGSVNARDDLWIDIYIQWGVIIRAINIQVPMTVIESVN